MIFWEKDKGLAQEVWRKIFIQKKKKGNTEEKFKANIQGGLTIGNITHQFC